MRTFTLSLLLLLAAILPAAAGPLEDGLAAYKKGDWDTAFKLLTPLASREDAPPATAQEKLGRLYESGNGTPKDPAAAMKWYGKAADQGDATAQARLSFLYRLGAGVKHDSALAAKWSMKAAMQGSPLGQSGLGYLASDSGDVGAAVGWFRKAADQGDASAMLGLGALCESGKGVPKDVVQAHKWYMLASVNDAEYEPDLIARAKHSADTLAGKMTPAQLAQAQTLEKDWKPISKR